MPKRDDIVLAVASRKVRVQARPVMPGPRQASIEKMGQVTRCIAAFDAGLPVWMIVCEAELRGPIAGTAQIEAGPVLDEDVELMAARAIGTLTNGITQRIVEQQQADLVSVPDLGALQG